METPKEKITPERQVERFLLDHRPCIGDSEDDDACKAKMGHSEAGAFVYHSEYAALLERVRQLEEALSRISVTPHSYCSHAHTALMALLKGEQEK